MKKSGVRKFKKIGIVALITTVLLSLFVVVAYADEEDVPQHTSCVEEYFEWLNNCRSHPKNNETCTYVVMSELMSFYDAYWHDDFVPVNYENTGIYQEYATAFYQNFHFKCENNTVENIDTDTISGKIEYRNFVTNEDNIDEYFQIYLISLGMELGYHNLSLSYGVTDAEFIELLEYYLYEKCGFEENEVDVKYMETNLSTTDADLFNTAKEQIKKGFPVIYGGYKANLNINAEWNVKDSFGGHYLIGYKLTKDENDIILSKGWNESDDGLTTTFHTTDFQYNKSIIWLEINEEELSHSCSTSYKYRHNSRDYELCVCQIYSGHPNHVCQVVADSEDRCTVSQTPLYCWCGQETEGTHSYNYNTYIYSSDFHWYECSCGDKTMSQAHTLVSEYDEEENIHYYTCYCGYREERHFFTYQDIGGGYHRGTCECGYTVTEIHNLVKKNPHYSTCMHCGYTKYTNGDIIEWPGILKRDDEEETE